MITNDPYGISNAVRPWDSLDAKKPIRRRKGNQRAINMCLTCPLYKSECSGQCTTQRKKPRKTGDPCQRCYSAEVCQRVGGTCNEKERYKGESTI